ncbi:cytochrome [Wenyingzhuangia fucanilytica]|uniref:Cytochrome n=1 Tax=Wenyingzhuangia fucanilytica TaxID=1790137 RepID=A0A1B1Y8X5_9FLAO|nr:cytochrome P450 [Wenyingzhuangia fucanilytica]ANW97227.1 cytochrome [Wenyingzhuangia fucanilytica]
MEKSKISDPFEKARVEKGYGNMDDQNDPVTILLRHKDVRKTAHNWKTFQSGGDEVGRIVIPSEVAIRDTRQIPFEVDPPLHKEFRNLLDGWFKRPNGEEYQAKLAAQIETLVNEVLNKDEVEVVRDFSLKLQSRALTLLLNTPFSESETWISWGTHVFRSEGESLDADKANVLYNYIDEKIIEASKNPGEDLYSVLLNSEVNGNKLTHEEVKGIMILTFAGGRDTVINALTNSIAYFAEHPKSLQAIKENPEMINNAVEELIRYFAPLTHMGRVVTEDTQVCEHAVKANTRVSLCWASANRDATVFENPNEVDFNRKMNPHVSFGFGTHNCLGATHARQIMRTLLEILANKVATIDIVDTDENIEELGEFNRKVGYNSITVKFNKY